MRPDNLWCHLSRTSVYLAAMLLFQSNALAGTPRGAIPGQILVKFRPDPAGPGLQAARDLSGARLQADAPLLGWQLLGLAPGSDLETELARFKARADVEFAEPNYRIERFSTPNDPRLSELWGLQAIRASQAWQHSTGSSQVVVAVIDGGIDASQADLVPNLWVNPGEIAGNGIDDDLNGATDDVHGLNTFPPGVPSTDDDGHGSHVAGIIGATGNNGIGTAGVCWNVRLLAIKIFTTDDGTGTAGAVRGYDYLLELRRRGVNIRVVNNSWGGPVPSLALREAICRAEAAGILSICAAGNRAVDTDYQPAFPAGLDCDGILSVAASRPDDGRASFSNFGNRTVDLAAPGERILSTYRRDGRYEFLSGTSMAAPFVSGVAALLWSHSSQLTPSQVKTVILASARPHPAWAGHTLTGGILDAGEAMARVVTGNFNP
ncbi:MAG: peptidase S8, partial [Verrucomicrobia bacterium]|nr:peptidase S8 [Verrucomicrobiota bacterium]